MQTITTKPLVEIHAPKKGQDGKWMGALRLNVNGEDVQIVMSASEPLLKQAYAYVLEQIYLKALGKSQVKGEVDNLACKAKNLILRARQDPEALKRVYGIVTLAQAGDPVAKQALLALRAAMNGEVKGCSGVGADPFYDTLWNNWIKAGANLTQLLKTLLGLTSSQKSAYSGRPTAVPRVSTVKVRR